MKTTTWNRDRGYVSVVLFENNMTAAVSEKIYKTQKGAEAANERLKELVGPKYSNMNLPYTTTNPKTGIKTTNYKTENLISLS